MSNRKKMRNITQNPSNVEKSSGITPRIYLSNYFSLFQSRTEIQKPREPYSRDLGRINLGNCWSKTWPHISTQQGKGGFVIGSPASEDSWSKWRIFYTQFRFDLLGKWSYIKPIYPFIEPLKEHGDCGYHISETFWGSSSSYWSFLLTGFWG